jgi:hypothetical protein
MDRSRDELELVSVRLFASDIEFFKLRYGRAWTEKLRHVMRREINTLVRLDRMRDEDNACGN